MKSLIIILSSILISSFSFCQIGEKQKDSLKSIISHAISEPSLNVPYRVTTNHLQYTSRSLALIMSKRDSCLIKISQTPRFSGVLVENENGGISETTDSTIIANLILKIRESVPSTMAMAPTEIIEEALFGDSTRIEWWNFQSKDGKPSKFGVEFTNGQMTVIYFKI